MDSDTWSVSFVTMPSMLIRHPKRYTVLCDFPARQDLAAEDEPADTVNMVLQGFACRYAVLPSGRRQILAYLIPGDLFDRTDCLHEGAGHFVGTLSQVKLARLARPHVAELAARSPQLADALGAARSAVESTGRQWLLNVGARTALERTAHLLSELFVRLQAAGLATGRCCQLGLTQTDLADALALSPVHVNRTLSQIRRGGLARFAHQWLAINNFSALQQVAGFDPQYLQADRKHLLWRLLEDRVDTIPAAGVAHPRDGASCGTSASTVGA
jgi:CRP-like cAMP-binding protein